MVYEMTECDYRNLDRIRNLMPRKVWVGRDKDTKELLVGWVVSRLMEGNLRCTGLTSLERLDSRVMIFMTLCSLQDYTDC